jgi:hypothetical protein
VLHSSAHRRATALRALAVALVLLSATCATPGQALAATKSTTASLTASQTAQIAAMQADFGTQVADYVAITRELHRSEDEVAQVTSQIASGTAQLETARSALATRAVELYRTPSVGLFESLLTATSVGDLVQRVNYLTLITEHDARLLKDLRLAQTEEAWLQESLQVRVVQLTSLQATADKKQARLLANLAAEQAKAAALNTVFTPGTDSSKSTVTPTGSVPRNVFDRSNVVSENNFRNGSALSAADIQAFLGRQPGALKNYTGKDHAGVTKSAAQMISDASVHFNINPKVILATLQKEQSLLSTKYPSQSQYNGAMGAGMPDSGKNNSSMQGFGNQIWWGAQKFDKNARDWHAGMHYVDSEFGLDQPCANEGTFAQYRYTPHYGGVMSFWTIFWRYFGDPLS